MAVFNDLGAEMDFEQVLYSRRAVREYTPEPVAKAVLGKLIDAAVQAPSAVNEQPWLFSVVTDRAVLARISEASKAHMLARPPPGVALALLHEVVENADFDILYHAPALIVISSASQGHWAVENCSLAAQNLMLAACAAGLGTCWIGFAQTWLGTPEGKATINVPQSCLPVAPIIVGHPQSEPLSVPRKAPDIAGLATSGRALGSTGEARWLSRRRARRSARPRDPAPAGRAIRTGAVRDTALPG